MNNKLIAGSIIALVAITGVLALALMSNDDNMTSDMKDNTAANQNMTSGKSSKSANSVQTTNQITYKGFEVVQPSIKVKKGTTVTWTNQDSAMHDVTPDMPIDEFKASELFGKGETRKVTFNTVGKYTYYCSPHPYMKGSIEVVE